MRKSNKKKSLLIVIILSILFLNPINIYALTRETAYTSINDTTDLTIGDLYFSDIGFNNSTNSYKTFGLTGLVTNSSENKIDYDTEIDYYDSNYNLLYSDSISNVADLGNSSYSQLSNYNNLKIDYNKISYYKLSVNLNDNISNNKIVIPSQSNKYSSYEYVIDKYDINIVVNKNNTFDITEKITAYFNVPKHGIFRTIPLKNKITRLDGTTSTNRAQITNLDVDNRYTTSYENNNYKIKIGSEDETVVKEHTYVIKYTYNIGKDPIKDYDELYYNIIGTDWDTVIGNVTFNIKMPKEFDSSKLGFSKGTVGSIDNNDVKYNVEGNTITGSYDGILEPGEAFTVRCELDDGYFVGAGLKTNPIIYLIFILPIIFLIISIILWHKYGRDDKVIETVEFYPPEGLNSLEVGFLYKGKADSQDVTSLLIYLANKGYIKITETETKSLFSKSKGFKITKLKEYDGNNENEKKFLKGLFTKDLFSTYMFEEEDNNESNNINEVTSSDLYNNFYITMNEILHNINCKKNKNEIFNKTASSKIIFVILMIIITFCLITIPPIIESGNSGLLIIALLFPGIGFSLMFSMLLGGKQTIYVNGKATNSSIVTKLFGLFWGVMFGGMPWVFTVLPSLQQNPIYLVAYIIGMICIIGMIICVKYLPRRTKYGNEILGRLRGFKNFLETSEKDKLEAMVMENPTYFYDILPYTYVLGVSDKWISKFETITMQAPYWYDSPNAFDVASFGAFMNATMTSAQSSMSSSHSSSSVSSGGGFSGGGSGGGGGGSW